MNWKEDVISDVLGDDWEKYICPIKGPPGMDLCYVDRNSEECRKCEEEYLKFYENKENNEIERAKIR